MLAYAFLVTYQVCYLLAKLGSTAADVPQQIFLGTLVQSVLVVPASLVGGRVSDRTGRRKVFGLVASLVYGCALFVLAGEDVREQLQPRDRGGEGDEMATPAASAIFLAGGIRRWAGGCLVPRMVTIRFRRPRALPDQGYSIERVALCPCRRVIGEATWRGRGLARGGV